MAFSTTSRIALSGLAAGIVMSAGCAQLSTARLMLTDFERSYDAYSQTDTTATEVTNDTGADGRAATLVSAFFGLDDELPRISNRFVCEGAGNADGMPVIFSHEVDPHTLEPGDFRLTTQSGAIGEVTCLTLAPADDPGELRTALLAGHYGSIGDQPATVEIVGNILSLDGSANFIGNTIEVTPLEVGPELVWAEIVPQSRWTLEADASASPFGGGNGCPAGTQQIVLATWNGGITKPGGDAADYDEGQLYQVLVRRPNGSLQTIAPFALGDTGDGDNNHKLCLDTTDQVLSVSFPAGHLTDPREDLNPATSISLADLQ